MTWEARAVYLSLMSYIHPAKTLVLTAFICSMLLSGCGGAGDLLSAPKRWIGIEEDPQAPTALTDLGSESLRLKKLWSNSVGAPEMMYSKLQPYIVDGLVYLAGADNRVEAWQLIDGKRIWSVKLQETISGGVNGGEQILTVGTENGLVIALDVADGKEKWRTLLSSEVLALSKVRHGVIVARTSDSTIHALDIGDGSIAWRASRNSPPLTLMGASQPKVAGSVVLVGFDDGKLVAFSLLDGEERWRATVSFPSGRSELERIADIDGEIAHQDDDVYAANFNGRTVAVDMLTGRVKWASDLASHTGLDIDESRVYVIGTNDGVWALDRATGATLWRQDKLLYRSLTVPVPVGDYVVVGDIQGYIHLLSKKDGKLVGRHRVARDAIDSVPVVIGQRICVLADNGSFTVLQQP
ncbi:MAG: outer membrane protein assembly factor BamB [Gammaproteobacteria bacterium]|nr:outer membrane protein assembly factor BamB [Gammaproteobacteria bacterium]